MDQSLTGLEQASLPKETVDSSLQQLLQGPVPGVMQTLAHNLQRIDRRNFRSERDTQRIVYARFVKELDANLRTMMLNAVIGSVRDSEVAPEALLAFIENDTSAGLVKTAIEHYLMLGTSRLHEPLQALTDILPMLSDPIIDTKGLILAGLLSFGDRRICAALRPYHSHLKLKTYEQLAVSIQVDTLATAPLHRCAIDHLLLWLVDLVREAKSKPALKENVSNLTKAVTSMVSQATSKEVEDRLFNFGHFPFASYTKSSTATYQNVIAEFEPIFDSLCQFENPAVDHLIVFLCDPDQEDSERRSTPAPRRNKSSRRSQDRRVVSIFPSIERREQNRRTIERRLESRR